MVVAVVVGSLFFLYAFGSYIMPIVLVVALKFFNKHNYLNKVSI